MPIPLLAIAGGAALAGIIGKGALASKQRKLANKIQINDPTYTENPLAKQQLAETTLDETGRMAGASQLEGNIYQTEADQLSQIEKYAPDAATALQAAGKTQASTVDAFGNLSLMEMEDDMAKAMAKERARYGVITEGDKVFADKLRKSQEAQRAKAALEGASVQNWNSAFSDFSNFGLMAASGQFGSGKSATGKGGFGGGGRV